NDLDCVVPSRLSCAPVVSEFSPELGRPPGPCEKRDLEPQLHESTSSARVFSICGGPKTSICVSTDFFHVGSSSLILASGPIRARSWTIFVGTAAIASRFLPSR